MTHKKSNRIIFQALAGLWMAGALAGCSLNDSDYASDSPMNNFWWGYADFRSADAGTAFELVADNGTILEIENDRCFDYTDYTIRDGMRVVASFSKLGESTAAVPPPRWQVRLNGIEPVLTKQPDVNPALGETDVDPIEGRHMWLSSKYLNVTFNFRFSDPRIVHHINLWVDTEHPEADAQNVYVELRHNAHGNGTSLKAFGRASFDLSGLLSEGQNTINVHFLYTDYSGRTHTFTKPYSPNINEEPGDLTVGSGSDMACIE